MEGRRSNLRLVAALVLIAVGGVAVCAMLIYREPPERRIAELGKFLAIAGIIAAFSIVLGTFQDRFKPPE